jgi:hypothetical protein
LKTINQQRIVEGIPQRSVPTAVGLDRFQLVSKRVPRVKQKTAYKRTLAIVDAATGHKSQDGLVASS